VRGLAARYPGADADAVTGVDLDLAPGRLVALMGPSGVGKSTVANVLERFLDYDGSVRLVGADGEAGELRELDSDAVRTVIGQCGQDAHVFDTTIGENVRLARRSATDAEVLDALDAARLGDWVRAQPQGLDAPVGAHGAALSGGQRQRLALARVLLADFDVVVLDEPTEHLDPETATALMVDLRAATADKAVLLITHHPADAAHANAVVLLEPSPAGVAP
jgi:ATP-binding cassette subfamily C protein CydCD